MLNLDNRLALRTGGIAGITAFEGYIIEIDAVCNEHEIPSVKAASQLLPREKCTVPKSDSIASSSASIQQHNLSMQSNSGYKAPKFIRPRVASSHPQATAAAVSLQHVVPTASATPACPPARTGTCVSYLHLHHTGTPSEWQCAQIRRFFSFFLEIPLGHLLQPLHRCRRFCCICTQFHTIDT